MDRFYTPTSIANVLAAAVNGQPRSVVDFAAGEGALLGAAFARWPDARLFASDIDADAVAGLENRFPGVRVECADFLGESPFAGNTFDLILLNPPFSCRGNERLEARVDGVQVLCSRAMAFVCRSLEYLSEGGEILCILPASCLSSEKDAIARATISATYGVEVIDAKVKAPFDKCSVVVSLIRVGRRVFGSPAWSLPVVALPEREPGANGAVTLGRGSTPVHKTRLAASASGSRFAHTTDLRAGIYTPSFTLSSREPDLRQESAVIFPRVGRPSKEKVVIARNETLVLSDCLFFIKATSESDLDNVYKLIISHWDMLARLYGGSCAPYVSLSQAKGFLEHLGFIVELDKFKRAPVKRGELIQALDEEFKGDIKLVNRLAGVQPSSVLLNVAG